MSASREKRTRKIDSAAEPEIKGKKPAKKAGKLGDRFYSIIGVAIALVLVISVGVSIFQNVVFTGSNFAAVDIGDEKVYPHEVNFYYLNSYMNFVNTYGEYASYMGLDTEKPLKSQQYSDEMTWHDFFLESALNSAQEVKMLNAEAGAAGVALSDEYKSKIDSDVTSLESSVSASNYTLETYLTTYYGKSMSVDEYKRLLGETYLAQQYGQQIFNGYTYGDDEMKAYYSEHKKDFDVVDYRYFFFSSVPAEENPTEEQTASAKTSAKSLADIMKNQIKDEQSFIELSKQNAAEDQKSYYEDESYTLREGATFASMSSMQALGDWLFDDARASGDKEVIETDTGYYVVYMLSRYRNDYNTANVRHILVQFDMEDDATEPTEEQIAAAKASAEDILKTWQDGEATEESFAQLATERSEDGGSAANGGLYEDVYKGQMVTAFENWTFDAARKPGDTGIVQTDYGFHVMYFVSTGSQYWTVQVDSTLRNDAYEGYKTSLKEKFLIKQHKLGLMAVGLPE